MKPEKLLNITSVSLIIFFILSCEKDSISDQCQSDGYEKLAFEKPGIGIHKDQKKKEYVITNDSSYYATLEQDSSALPNIDFAKKTLIGKYAGLTCSEENYLKYVCINREKSHVVYHVKRDMEDEEVTCNALVMSMNWIIVPVSGDKYTFDFRFKTD